jgi:glutathione S-transferase
VTGRRPLIYAVFLLLLPLLVAWYDLSPITTLALVLLALLWRWMISLSGLMVPARTPELELETISASHFVEKVRWCMDRLGVTYVEKPVGGTLGAFFLGRTVPLLRFRSGAVRSSIGNSAEILRYLWGRYAPELGGKASFLSADPERLALEKKIDRCGADLQVWVYYHVLPDRELTLHAWGTDNKAIPAWQRLTLKILYPVLVFLIRKSFRISDAHHARAVQHVDALLSEVESLLGDGRQSILGGDEINYTDIAFAAIMGLWLQPAGYGGGMADSVKIESDRTPERMRTEIERWSATYPKATAFIENLYLDRRNPPNAG